VVKRSDSDQVLLIAAGVTLHEALKAAQELETRHNTKVRVIDIFSIKPIDSETIVSNAKQCGGKVITIEDHYPEGGIGEAVASTLVEHSIKVHIMAVKDIPRSGPPQALIDKYGIGSKSIVEEVLKFK